MKAAEVMRDGVVFDAWQRYVENDAWERRVEDGDAEGGGRRSQQHQPETVDR